MSDLAVFTAIMSFIIIVFVMWIIAMALVSISARRREKNRRIIPPQGGSGTAPPRSQREANAVKWLEDMRTADTWFDNRPRLHQWLQRLPPGCGVEITRLDLDPHGTLYNVTLKTPIQTAKATGTTIDDAYAIAVAALVRHYPDAMRSASEEPK